MSDFAIRAGSIDVEEIMRHIRTRIRDKRGVDYTDKEIRELADVKLERILDPTGIRSDLLEHYRQRSKDSLKPSPRQSREASTATLPPLEPMPPNFAFEANTIYESKRGIFGRLVYVLRRLLNPLLKLFFNPNPIVHVLHMQSELNRAHAERFDRIFERIRDHFGSVEQQFDNVTEQQERVADRFAVRHDLDTLNYEVLSNLVVEMTKLGIEVKNLQMQVQSVGSRLDFDERRARALEGLVTPPQDAPRPSGKAEPEASSETDSAPGQRRRRRRRRGGRRRVSEAKTADAGTTAAPGTSDVAPVEVADAAEPPSASADAAELASTSADAPPPDTGSSVDVPTSEEAAAPESPQRDGNADTPEQ